MNEACPPADHDVGGDPDEDGLLAGAVIGRRGRREDTIVVTAEAKLAIAGNLEAAHEALVMAWELWGEKARARAWAGRYWKQGDVADLERLILDALSALEGTGRALGAVVDAGDAPRRAEGEDPHG